MSDSDKPTFYVKSADGGFASRQKNIFDQLNLINSGKKRVEHDATVDIDTGPESEVVSVAVAVVRQKRKETRSFRGKESIFKRPETLPPRFKARNTPDYQRHPDKWIKYSLADVSSDDMSERSNTATAMAFLQEMKERKNKTKSEDDTSCLKITFRPREAYSHKYDSTDEKGSEKGLFSSSKVVMPEYVVGRESKSMKRNKEKKTNPGDKKKHKELKLDHLIEEDE